VFRSDTIRQSVSVPFDYTHDLAGIQAAVLLIHGRYNRMAPFEVSIAILNHIADWHLVLLNNSGNWPPFEKAGRVGPLTPIRELGGTPSRLQCASDDAFAPQAAV